MKQKLILVDHMPYLVNRAGNLVIQLFTRDLSQWGVTVPIWRILAVLGEHGPQRLIDLALLTSIDVSTLSRTVGTMVRRGFILRGVAPDNRREVVISITPQGRRILDKALPSAIRYEQSLMSGLPKKDIDAAKRVLTAMFERLAEQAGRSLPATEASRKSTSRRSSKPQARK
jgi:DNA-binding MarR family transcriptional regulator